MVFTPKLFIRLLTARRRLNGDALSNCSFNAQRFITTKAFNRLAVNNYNRVKFIGSELLKNKFGKVNIEGKRFLFSPETLGYDGFKRQKALIAERVGNAKEKFFDRVDKHLLESEDNTIFSEDLRVAVYISENDKEIGVTENMIRRFHRMNLPLRLSTFVFGPIVLRLLHIQNKPDMAISLFNDPEMDKFFDQQSSFLLFMDLLYRNNRFEEVVKAMDKMIDKSLGGIKYSVDCLTLAAASCYKLNKPEYLNKYVHYLHESKGLHNHISMRTIIYGAMLAYNQKNFTLALDILSEADSEQDFKLPVALLNARVLAYTELNRFDDAVRILKMVVQNDSPYSRQRDVFEEVLDKLMAKLKANKHITMLANIENMAKDLKSSGRLMQFSFSEYLDSEIHKIKKIQAGFKQRVRTSVEPQFDGPITSTNI